MSWSMRLAGPDDAEQVWAVQREGFEGYRSFAPVGWEPPDPSSGLQMARERLASRDVWCLIAEADGAPAGHVAMMPASQHPHRISDEPGLIHFWQLFVRPPWHGSGLATALHAEALREARARGFTTLRLFTPAGQARARRFYEREGWRAAGEPFEDEDFGMSLVEYRRAVR